MAYLVIGLAGSIGALLRYYAGLWSHEWWASPFPLGTLITNYLGCFVLAWFSTWVVARPVPEWLRLGITTGLIGSFTTFSTFSVETVQLLHAGLFLLALIYVLTSLWGGLLLAWLGYRLAAAKKA
ncbi:fluoride efflux transporter CrcB [Brevibacillus massiliensis]|jgi:CrcB protein|uniref:fluoride efflux transporter CrcB n=1 Tax=Brevibacillus massiliensis TaxID=1118054 RepID=UPI000300BA92|nr:fluoride efflux transporter CrcB [Brevibacillus massiliensis]